jgi:hypothetical protein
VVTTGSTAVGVVISVAGLLTMVTAAVVLFVPHRRLLLLTGLTNVT